MSIPSTPIRGQTPQTRMQTPHTPNTPYSSSSSRFGDSHTPNAPRLDSAIHSIQPKSMWGFTVLPDGANRNSILTVANNEYVMAVGSNLSIYSDTENKPSKLVLPHVPEVSHVTFMSLSNDCAYLAAGFKVRGQENPLKATLFVYDMASQGTGLPQKPRVFSYTYLPPSNTSANANTVAEELDSIEQHQFTAAAFSQDNVLLACATNLSMVGCLVFDAIKCEVMIQLPTGARVSQVSFNPRDPQKLCTIGDKSIFQLWRLAAKIIHPYPIHGLTQSTKYTSLVWLEGEESRIVAGSQEGFLVIVQGSEQLQPPCYAFGAPGQQGAMSSGIVNLITRGDYIVAVSEFNYFSLLEIKRFSGSGAQGGTAILIPLGIFQLADVDIISGIQWAAKMAASSLQYSFVVVVASSSTVSLFDIKADSMGSKASVAGGAGGGATVGSNTLGRQRQEAIAPVVLNVVKCDRVVTNFHSGAVNSLSLAGRNCTYVTASSMDESLKVRNFSSFNGPCLVSTTFSEFKNQIPNFVDMHPSGLFVASACEDEAVEFMISDGGVGAVRRISVKIPITLPNGAPFVNTQHVSIVRYSHSGHLLAVVTGKFARVFNMLDLDIASTDMVGSPKLTMFMTDNTGNITDLAFSKDDKRIFTTAADGFVYSWAVGESVRSGEFNYKGFSATKVVTNDESLVVAIFESEAVNTATLTRKSTRVGFGPSTGKKGLVNSRRGPGGGGLTRSNSSATEVGVGITRTVISAGTGAGTPGDTLTSTELNFGDMNTLTVDSFIPKRFLMMWTENVSVNKGTCIYLESPVTAIALGAVDAPTKRQVCVLGLSDGRVLVSLLPFPLRSFNMHGFSANPESSHFLDESKCKHLQLHKSSVSSVAVSLSGLWIFSAGNDGSIYMLSTSIRARDMSEIPEALTCRENDYVLTEKEQLMSLRSRIADVETTIAENKRDSERIISKLTESAAEVKAELEKRMKNDIKKRDEIILKGREDLIKSNKDFNAQINKIKTEHAREIAELESMYERKLSKEGLYLEKMRQAYDEFVLHARMDMNDLRDEVEREKKTLESKHNINQKDAEKQKSALLLYVDFVNARNKEVLEALEDHQDSERFKLKNQLVESAKVVERSQQEGRSEIATLTIQNGKLKHVISSREDDIMRLQSDLGWANDRIKKLEGALHEAAGEMKKKGEVAERWEFKAGEVQQQVSELERIRKALTSQLHGLRQELGPKEEKLSQISERLQEVDREYELTLHAISDKEKTLSKQNQNLALLKKQARDYRSLSARRELSLRRAAKLLDEFKLSLEEAQFKAYKKTVQTATGATDGGGGSGSGGGGGGGEDMGTTNPATLDNVVAASSAPMNHRSSTGQIVEIMARTEDMENSLRRLSDLLGPYLKAVSVEEDAKEDEILAAEERERQLKLLHKSIRGLQSNLDNTSLLAQTKVGTHLADNRILLEEINMLRQQVRSVSMENQRLKAKIEFSDVLLRKGQGESNHLGDRELSQLEYSRKLQDSQSDASLVNNNGRGGGGGSIISLTKSRSTDSNIIQLTGGSKHDLQLSGSNSLENMASSISLDAQRNAAEIRDQLLSKLSETRSGVNGMGMSASNQRSMTASRDGPSGPLSRIGAADKKIAAIMKENEDAIREGAAADILASYQKHIQESSLKPGVEAKIPGEGGKGKAKVVTNIPAVQKRAVPLSVERLNQNVVLPLI